MPGETQLHRTLKKEACHWLYRVGYTAVAAEVRLPPMGIVDSVGTGVFRPYFNHHGSRCEVHQTCIVECKASRADFLRDKTHDGQMSLCLMERATNNARARRPSTKRRNRFKQNVGLGKFAACLMHPFANLHYILAPAGIVKKTDLPPRWGLLTLGPGGIAVVVKAQWQELSSAHVVESRIAQTLTNDIFRADDRAINSVNRELFQQQTALAERIRQLRPFAPSPFPGGGELFRDIQSSDDATPVDQAATEAADGPVEA